MSVASEAGPAPPGAALEPPSGGGRWLGIDLLRGVAAFGVVVIHSWGHAPRTRSSDDLIVAFLSFAVPYFLATSLFLTAGRFLGSGTRGFLRTRVRRLLVPYVVWSLIFLAMRSAVQAASGRWGDLRALWARPLDLLFLGKASGQLYFVPMLFVGELMALALFRLAGDRLRRVAVVLPLLATAVALAWFAPLRYAPALDDPHLSAPAHTLLGLLNFAVWCLPYVAGGFALRLDPVRRGLARLGPSAGLTVLAALLVYDLLFSFGVRGSLDQTFPPAVRELVLAFGLLVSGVALSGRVRPSRWLMSLGASAFGVYLAHPLFLQVVEPVLARLSPVRPFVVTPPLMASSAALVFALTWLAVAAVLKFPAAASVLFGTAVKAPEPRP